MTADPAADLAAPTVYEVPEENVRALGEHLAKLNRRAEKLGLAPATVSQVGYVDRPVWRDNKPVLTFTGQPVLRRYAQLTVDFVSVRLAGWTLAAAIDHLVLEDGEVANLIRCAPGVSGLPSSYRTDAATCDHCQAQRKRRQTFVVAHEDGRLARVGRQCLRDFLGGKDADRLLAQATWLLEFTAALDEGMSYGGGSHGLSRFDVTTILAYTAAAVRSHGWFSRAAARESQVLATADRVWGYVTYRSPKDGDKPPALTEEDRALAEATMEWVRGLDGEAVSDYLHNLRVACLQGGVGYREVGLASSALTAYVREQGRMAAAAAEAAMPGYHLGDVGTKFTLNGAPEALEVTICGRHSVEGEYGVTTIFRFRTATGADLLWRASGAMPAQLDRGARVVVTGTVKDHTQDKRSGRPVTVLTRCTLTEGTLAKAKSDRAEVDRQQAQVKAEAKAWAASPQGLREAVGAAMVALKEAEQSLEVARSQREQAEDSLARSLDRQANPPEGSSSLQLSDSVFWAQGRLARESLAAEKAEAARDKAQATWLKAERKLAKLRQD